MSISSATPSITCRARPMTTACRSCAGSTTDARSRTPAATSPPGSSNGGSRYPKPVIWVEETIEETLTFYRLPRQHHKHLNSTNASTRRSGGEPYVVRIFPNSNACSRLIRALAVETYENWLEAHRYLNMNDLKEHKKIQLRQAA